MKKVLISVLVALCVLGTVSTGFAATYSDTTGTKYESAVEVLSSLGLLRGYPDGTFKPTGTITRAEFATIAVRALGLDAAASQATGATPFRDVPAGHWAVGYINIAADQKLVNGYPDGTFKPERPVSYAEAITVLVRMLGYGPVVSGSWPTGYLVKGYELGLPAGVTFSSGSPAIRGDIAVFFDNSLTIHLMEQVYSGALVTYAVTDKTVLEDKLGFESVTGYVSEVPSLFGSDLDDDEVRIDDETYEMAAGLDLADWLGQEVQAWYREGEIVVAANLTASDDLVTGEITDIAADGDTVKIEKKTYDAAGGFFAVSNNVDVDEDEIAADDPDFMGYEATAVLDDDGDIVSLVAVMFDDSLLLTKLTPNYNRFEGRNEAAALVKRDLDTDYDEYIILKGGFQVELEDLAVGEIARYFVNEDGLYMEVTAEIVEGELEAIETGADEELILTIDGEEYVLAAAATFSADENETFVAYGDETDLAPFVGEDITAYLDADGYVRHLSGAVEVAAPSNIGVVKTQFYVVESPDPTDPDQTFVKIFKLDGTTARIEFTDETEFDGEDEQSLPELNAAYPVGTMAEYAVDSDGVMASLEAIDPVGAGHADHDLTAAEVDDDRNLVWGHRATAASVFIDMGAWKVYNWATFKGIHIATSPIDGTAVYDEGDATLEYLVYNGTGHGVTFAAVTAKGGVVTGRQVIADGVKVKVLAEDKIYSYLVDEDTDLTTRLYDNHGADNGAVTDLDVGDYVEFESDGTVYTMIEEKLAIDPFDAGDYVGYVEEMDVDDLVLALLDDLEDPEASAEFILDPEGLVYDLTDTAALAEFDDIATDQTVQIFDLDDDDVYDLVKIIE